jgi:squalene-hopene/tetraprenyl-beta-curcumene cyclase
MTRKAVYACLALAVCVGGIGLWWSARARAAEETTHISYLKTWNPQAAAGYLDRREVWWQYWPPARKEQGTVCISCHTVVPYAMVRPALQQQLRATEMPAPEKVMMDSVEKRVEKWSEMTPFYTDDVYGPGKSAESRATEAVLNAVILTSCDAQNGHLRPITRTALDEAWALQEKTGDNAGGWRWQDFHLAPWESAESGYQGAALLMLVVQNAPDGYAKEPAVQESLERLQEYLRGHYASQPLVNQLYVLWLASSAPGLLTADERKALIRTVKNHQQADGGWSLFSLDPKSQRETEQWKRIRERFLEMATPVASDGYATALAVMALQESRASREDSAVKRGLEWLETHQGGDGAWHAESINEKRDPRNDIAPFMSDAATAYAVMALEKQQQDQAAGR